MVCWIKKQNVLKAKIIVFVNNLFCYGSNSFHELFKWAFQFVFFLSWQLNEENGRLNIIYFWLLNSAKFFYVCTTQFCLVQNRIDQCSRRSNGVILEELSNLYWVTMKLFLGGGGGWWKVMWLFSLCNSLFSLFRWTFGDQAPTGTI